MYYVRGNLEDVIVGLHSGVVARVCNAMNKFVKFKFTLWRRSGRGNIIRREVLISAYMSYTYFALDNDLAMLLRIMEQC